MLEMLDRDRVSDTKINLANKMIETLEELVENLGDGVSELRDELGGAREEMADLAHQHRRLETSLFLAGMIDKAEAAVRIYTGVEKRVLDGDLKVLKEAAGSPEKVNLLVEVYNCALPPDAPLTEDQQRFRNALVLVRDELNKQNKADAVSEVEAQPLALPHVRQALEKFAEDCYATPFAIQADCAAFQEEMEQSLSDEDLIALRDGNVEVLSSILGAQLEEVEQLRLALTYYQQTDVEIPNHALRSVVDRLVDVEEPETLTHRDGGLIH